MSTSWSSAEGTTPHGDAVVNDAAMPSLKYTESPVHRVSASTISICPGEASFMGIINHAMECVQDKNSAQINYCQRTNSNQYMTCITCLYNHKIAGHYWCKTGVVLCEIVGLTAANPETACSAGLHISVYKPTCKYTNASFEFPNLGPSMAFGK